MGHGPADGAPGRLTPEGFAPFEFAPAWSPDGQWVAFTTLGDTMGGQLWKIRASGGEPERLTREPGEFIHPAWSPDGRRSFCPAAPAKPRTDVD